MRSRSTHASTRPRCEPVHNACFYVLWLIRCGLESNDTVVHIVQHTLSCEQSTTKETSHQPLTRRSHSDRHGGRTQTTSGTASTGTRSMPYMCACMQGLIVADWMYRRYHICQCSLNTRLLSAYDCQVQARCGVALACAVFVSMPQQMRAHQLLHCGKLSPHLVCTTCCARRVSKQWLLGKHIRHPAQAHTTLTFLNSSLSADARPLAARYCRCKCRHTVQRKKICISWPCTVAQRQASYYGSWKCCAHEQRWDM